LLKNKFLYISVVDEVSDFKFSKHLRFAEAHHKILPREKVGVPWARGAPQNLGFSYNIFATAGG